MSYFPFIIPMHFYEATHFMFNYKHSLCYNKNYTLLQKTYYNQIDIYNNLYLYKHRTYLLIKNT